MLVTSGSGSIGSRLVDALLAARHTETLVDDFIEQIYGKSPNLDLLHDQVKWGRHFERGDIRNRFADLGCSEKHLGFAPKVSVDYAFVVAPDVTDGCLPSHGPAAWANEHLSLLKSDCDRTGQQVAP